MQVERGGGKVSEGEVGRRDRKIVGKVTGDVKLFRWRWNISRVQ